MQSQINQLIAWHAKLNIRERILVGLGAVAAVWMVWLFAVWDVLGAGIADAESDLRTVQTELASATVMQQTETDLARSREELMARAARLTAELETEKQALDSTMTGFVKPDDISQVLQDVLATNRGVKLVALKSLPVKVIPVSETVVFYQHPLTVELEGSFSAIYAYLNAVEKRSGVISFHSLEYEVQEHPEAIARVELSTVSRSKEWLGV